jgi:hypothetical protein
MALAPPTALVIERENFSRGTLQTSQLRLRESWCDSFTEKFLQEQASSINGWRFEPWDVLSFFTMTDLAHKIVLVSGASGGLGHALAEAFAAQESRVVISARNHEQLNRAAEEMDRNGAQVCAWPGDIRRRDQTNHQHRVDNGKNGLRHVPPIRHRSMGC